MTPRQSIAIRRRNLIWIFVFGVKSFFAEEPPTSRGSRLIGNLLSFHFNLLILQHHLEKKSHVLTNSYEFNLSQHKNFGPWPSKIAKESDFQAF